MAVEAVEIVLNGVDNASPVVDKVSQKLVASEEKYLSKLKEQFIAQTQGAEAAERFKLAEMGFSEATIESAMALRQQMQAAKEAAEALEQTGQQVQETGKSLKDTSEASQKVSGVFSKVFGAFGLGELSMFSDQMGGLSGQVKELEEAGIKGGGAFKAMAVAGMAVAAVAAGWKIGTMIADWIYQTEEWNRKMKETLDLIGQQASFANKKSQQQFDLQMQLAAAAATEEQRQMELANIRAAKDKEIAEARKKLAKEEKELKDALANDTLGYGTEDNAAAEEAVKLAKERLALLREQRAEADKAIRGPTDQEAELEQRLKVKEADQAIAELQQQIATIQDPKKAELELLLKQAANDEQRKTLELLWQQKEATQAKADADKAAAEKKKKDDADAEAAAKAQLKTNEDYIAGLKARNIELTEGKRAADEFKAAQSGVSAEVIAQGREMAIQNDLLEAQKQLKDEQKKQDDELAKKLATPAPQLQAMQSRLLTRSGQSNLGERQAKANEKVADLTEKIEGLQREHQKLLEEIRTNTRNQILVVN